MDVKILGTMHSEDCLEYVLSFKDINPGDVRDKLFKDIVGRLRADFPEFRFTRRTSNNSPPILVVSNPIKQNPSGIIRVDNTLYPNYMKLRVFSPNLAKSETLYGGTVSAYFDRFIREAIPSADTPALVF